MTATNAAMSANATVNVSRSHRARRPAWAGLPDGAGRMRPGGPMRRRWLTEMTRASLLPRMPFNSPRGPAPGRGRAALPRENAEFPRHGPAPGAMLGANVSSRRPAGG